MRQPVHAPDSRLLARTGLRAGADESDRFSIDFVTANPENPIGSRRRRSRYQYYVGEKSHLRAVVEGSVVRLAGQASDSVPERLGTPGRQHQQFVLSGERFPVRRLV
jgi:hypothetical protein